MPYLNIKDGVVVGVSAENPQPGWSNEKVPADDPRCNALKEARAARIEAVAKREAALAAMQEKLLAEAARDPNAHQAVKDYAAAVAAQKGR